MSENEKPAPGPVFTGWWDAEHTLGREIRGVIGPEAYAEIVRQTERADAAEAEVERLTRERDHNETLWTNWKARVASLTAAIENAPHSALCDLVFYTPGPTYKCNCWKARALEGSK